MSLPLNPYTQNHNKVASFYRHSLKLPQMQAPGNIQDFCSLFFSLPSKASKESKKVISYNIKGKMKEALQCNDIGEQLTNFLGSCPVSADFWRAQPRAPGSSKYLFSIFQPAVESF
jgi:hypothetical protein